jgi:hypothetical protein
MNKRKSLKSALHLTEELNKNVMRWLPYCRIALRSPKNSYPGAFGYPIA